MQHCTMVRERVKVPEIQRQSSKQKLSQAGIQTDRPADRASAKDGDRDRERQRGRQRQTETDRQTKWKCLERCQCRQECNLPTLREMKKRDSATRCGDSDKSWARSGR